MDKNLPIFYIFVLDFLYLTVKLFVIWYYYSHQIRIMAMAMSDVSHIAYYCNLILLKLCFDQLKHSICISFGSCPLNWHFCLFPCSLIISLMRRRVVVPTLKWINEVAISFNNFRNILWCRYHTISAWANNLKSKVI